MNHPAVYELSKRHGPPHVDLRQAEIKDSYGDESHATRPICHRVPEDVTKEDLDFYPQVWGFLERSDIFFYLYPVALAYESDRSLECIDQYLYSLNRVLEPVVKWKSVVLSDDDNQALLDGVLWMWNSWTPDDADWLQCPHLQELIGITVYWDGAVEENRKQRGSGG